MMKKFFRSMSDFMTSCSFHLLRERFVGSDNSVFSAFVDETSWNEVAEELVGHLRGGHDKTNWDRLVPRQVSEKKRLFRSTFPIATITARGFISSKLNFLSLSDTPPVVPSL
jgi:hypothetical protein